MKIGFTGTRLGMSEKQKNNFSKLIEKLLPEEFVHGDCVGADTDAHQIAYSKNIDIVIRPCNHELRANNDNAKFVHDIKTPFARNRDIVDSVDLMIACPATEEEQKYGGTWYTINYAKKKKKQLIILYPSGNFEKFT